VAAARRGKEDLRGTVFNTVQEIHELAGPVSADARAKLVTPNHHGHKRGNTDFRQELEHVLFSLLLRDGAKVSRFRTVIRAFKIRVAYIDVPRRAGHRSGEKRMNGLWDSPALPSLRTKPHETPLCSQMYGQGRDDPVRLRVMGKGGVKKLNPILPD